MQADGNTSSDKLMHKNAFDTEEGDLDPVYVKTVNLIAKRPFTPCVARTGKSKYEGYLDRMERINRMVTPELAEI